MLTYEDMELEISEISYKPYHKQSICAYICSIEKYDGQRNLAFKD